MCTYLPRVGVSSAGWPPLLWSTHEVNLVVAEAVTNTCTPSCLPEIMKSSLLSGQTGSIIGIVVLLVL